MDQSSVSASTRSWYGIRIAARECIAGFIGSIVLITDIVSFSGLMFPAALAAGASTAVWAMLIGNGIVGLWVSRKTTLPPLATGMDSPTAAMLVVIAATAGHTVLSSGGTPQQAIQAAMLLFTLASLLSGALLLCMGFARWGSYLRFVPFFVIAGFFAATGWLLIAGGIRMTTGTTPADLLSTGASSGVAKLSCAMVVCIVFVSVRRWARWPLAQPASLIAMTLLGTVALRALGLSDPAHGWYLPSLKTLTPWLPAHAAHAEPISLAAALRFVPELFAVAIVALLSLVTKTSSLELARKSSSDLDVELRAYGVGTLVAAPLGGVAGSMAMGTSRLLEQAGGTRVAGVACALVLISVGLLNLDLLSLLPLPIAAGLLLQLGWGFLVEAFSKSLRQQDWLNLALAVVIAAACVRFGYIAGVIGGVVCACLMFAAGYARVGVVRQHLSRAQFAGNVSRSTEAAHHLSEAGEAIQIYWLSGYIFFGSSESVFERARRDVRSLPPGRVNHLILDLGLVSGLDASATISLAKLRNFCQQQGAKLIFSSMAPKLRGALERDGFFRDNDAQPRFPDVMAALAWCEDALLARSGLPTLADDAGQDGMEVWLQRQLGTQAQVVDFMPYLERRSFGDGQVIYRQGEVSDAIDLVVSGRLGVDVSVGGTQVLRVRRITTQTVVGEMGFFGHAARSATITAEGPATVLTLTRASFERLRRERPDLASALYEFLLRTLSDRIRLTDKMVWAMRL
jgi:sulfate permease, SulP family